MSEDHLERDVLGRVGMDRRSFIKKVILGTAFAVPVVVSFDMLTSPLAGGATCTAANGSSGSGGTGTTGGAGGTKKNKGTTQGACGGDPDGGTGGAGGTSTVSDDLFSDRNRKTDVIPVAW